MAVDSMCVRSNLIFLVKGQVLYDSEPEFLLKQPPRMFFCSEGFDVLSQLFINEFDYVRHVEWHGFPVCFSKAAVNVAGPDMMYYFCGSTWQTGLFRKYLYRNSLKCTKLSNELVKSIKNLLNWFFNRMTWTRFLHALCLPYLSNSCAKLSNIIFITAKNMFPNYLPTYLWALKRTDQKYMLRSRVISLCLTFEHFIKSFWRFYWAVDFKSEWF